MLFAFAFLKFLFVILSKFALFRFCGPTYLVVSQCKLIKQHFEIKSSPLIDSNTGGALMVIMFLD